MELMGGNALLGGTKHVGGIKPFVQGDVRTLIERPDADRELLATVAAAKPALAHRTLGRKRLDRLLLSTEGANRAIGPAVGFQELPGFIFVCEGLAQNGHGL